jgi:phosphoenolpyruvate-protein kinase (PTS system EI component)
MRRPYAAAAATAAAHRYPNTLDAAHTRIAELEDELRMLQRDAARNPPTPASSASSAVVEALHAYERESAQLEARARDARDVLARALAGAVGLSRSAHGRERDRERDVLSSFMIPAGDSREWRNSPTDVSRPLSLLSRTR